MAIAVIIRPANSEHHNEETEKQMERKTVRFACQGAALSSITREKWTIAYKRVIGKMPNQEVELFGRG